MRRQGRKATRYIHDGPPRNCELSERLHPSAAEHLDFGQEGALPDAELDAFVSNLVRRVGSFDVQALRTAKSLLNQSGLPDEARLRATQDIFFGAYGWEGARERAPRLRELGWGQPGDFELRVGPLLADLKR